jgi:hypothetical protein
VLKLTGFLFWWKALTIHTTGYCYHWEIIPSGNLPFMKKMLLDGFLEVEPTRAGITLADGLCNLCGNHFDFKASINGKSKPCPF